MNQQQLVTDTSIMWTIDGVSHPEYRERLHIECLLRLIDAAVRPTNALTCLIPSLDRGEGEKALLPDSYQALAAAGLVDIERRVDANKFLPKRSHLRSTLGSFVRWHNNSPDYARAYLELHLDRKVRGGWEHRVPDEGVPDSWRGVPAYVYTYYMTNRKEVDVIASQFGWKAWEAMFLFSIVSRGLQYAMAATEVNARYLTHPIRWLGPANLVREALDQRSPDLPVAIVIYEAWRQSRHFGDFPWLADTLASIRHRAETDALYESLLQQSTTGVETEDRLRELVRSALPARLSVELIDALRKSAILVSGAVTAIATHALGEVGAFTAGVLTGWYLDSWLTLVKDVQVSPAIAALPIVRSHVDYGSALTLPGRSCPRCGSLWDGSRCVVCSYPRALHRHLL